MIFRNSHTTSMAVFFFPGFLLFLSSFPHLSFQTCPGAYLPPIIVQFSFAVKTTNQFDRCVYPGFNLTSAGKTPIISLPSSGNFTVVDINYSKQLISLSDPDRCLPIRILKPHQLPVLRRRQPELHVTQLLGAEFIGFGCGGGDVSQRREFHGVRGFQRVGGREIVVGIGPLPTSVLAPIMSLSAGILTHLTPGTAFMELHWDVPDYRRCVDSYYGVDLGFTDCEFKDKSGLEVEC